METSVEISGLIEAQTADAYAFCVLRFRRPASRDKLVRVYERLVQVVGPDAASDLPEELPEEPLVITTRWIPPQPAGLDAQRKALLEVGRDEGIERVWCLQLGTSLEEDVEDEEAEASWSHGAPPGQADVPFPVDGTQTAIDDFDWYDFGIAVKFAAPLPPGGVTVVNAFHGLWVVPFIGCFRNTAATLDVPHHAAHFWADRWTGPLSEEQSVHNLMWAMAQLHEVIPILHATFQPATMQQKFGPLMGDESEPFVLAGNPISPLFDRDGYEAVERWRSQQTHWSPEEVAKMLQQTAISVVAGSGDSEEDADEDGDENALDPDRAANALRLIRDAIALAPNDDEIQFTFGRLLIATGDDAGLLAGLSGFHAGTRLQLINALGDEESTLFAAALDTLLEEPFPEQVLGESSRSCGGATISSFGDQSTEMLAELAGHTASLAPKHLDDVLARLPDDIDGLSTVAHQLQQADHVSQAMSVYGRIIDQPPPEFGSSDRQNYCRALNNACILAHSLKDYASAVQIADRAQPFAHENPYVYHSAACAYAAAGDLETAFAQIEKAVDHDYANLAPDTGSEASSFVESDEDLGEILQWPKFKDLFARWREARALFVSGTEALQGDDPDTAIPLLEKASSKTSPLARKAMINLGLAHSKAGGLEEMLASSLNALSRFPGDADVFANLCYAARELGRLPELVPVVLETYRHLRPEPRNVENATFVLNESNEHERSTEVIEWWASEHGTLPAQAMGNAVNAFLKSGRAQEGLVWARRLVEADPDATSYWFLSYALIDNEDVEGALQAAAQVHEHDEDVFEQLAADADMAKLTANSRFVELRNQLT